MMINMAIIPYIGKNNYSVLSLCCGSGGLDLGFEYEHFNLLEAIDINPWCIETLKLNRPHWKTTLGDIKQYTPNVTEHPDVLIAGVPCQGFSLGGNRQPDDERNELYKEVIRIAKTVKPRVILIENVLNLRTMIVPGTKHSFAKQIALEIESLGYDVFFDVFKMCNFDVPQTRRRFVFVGFLGKAPSGYRLPTPRGMTSIRDFLYDLAQNDKVELPNHDPKWGSSSKVHIETGLDFDPTEEVVPIRISRTASDGYPVRSFDDPFPAVDTATVWGWAQGNVTAKRYEKDRTKDRFIRNPEANVTLWRISASRMRTFTHREYARLQTFPDNWEFVGNNKRDVHLQIGNAVPVKFAEHLARNIKSALQALDNGTNFEGEQEEQCQIILPF